MADVPAEGAVPPVVVPAVVAHPDIHAVLVICGFANIRLLLTLKVFSRLRTLAYWKIRTCLKWLTL
jgi:hypothetical protein